MKPPGRPCAECPWAKTTKPGQFPRERYDALRTTTVSDHGYGPELGAAMFACHKSPAGEEFPCAGWLAAVGDRSVTVRLNVACGALSPDTLRPGDDWPELFTDYDEMAAYQGVDDADDVDPV